MQGNLSFSWEDKEEIQDKMSSRSQNSRIPFSERNVTQCRMTVLPLLYWGFAKVLSNIPCELSEVCLPF